MITYLEPASSTAAQRLGLCKLAKAQDFSIKLARCRLAALRRRQLNVIQP
jgi:hypothetical protein